MSTQSPSLSSDAVRAITSAFSGLDYATLGLVYCDEGGEAFWKAQKTRCRTMGSRVAKALKSRLPANGRSLYVGAGVAEIPALIVETMDLAREVHAYNLRELEVRTLNPVCQQAGITVVAQPAETATGLFDHLWIVSVLNDPERFPELSALSYNRADPIHFDPRAFSIERDAMRKMLSSCMEKLRRPALVTTSIEEQPWIIHWCETHDVPFHTDPTILPTALVEDPICFLRIGLQPFPTPPPGLTGQTGSQP